MSFHVFQENPMIASVVEDLRALLSRAERATQDEWDVLTDGNGHTESEACTIGACGPISFGVRTPGYPGGNYRDTDFGSCEADAGFIVAAFNFIRTHGPEVLQALARGPQQAGGEDWPKVMGEYLVIMTRCEASIRESGKATLSRTDMEAIERYNLADEHLSMMQADRIAELEAALLEAGGDAERLDWLDGFAASSYFTISEYFGRAGKDRYVEIQDEDDAVISEAPTLRESIDKAMAWWEIKLREDAALNEGQDDA